MKLPDAVPQDVMEFLTRFAGAGVSALEQLAFEWYWAEHPEIHGKFPYMRPIEGTPMYSDLIVGGLAVAPWVIALLVEDAPNVDFKTKEAAKVVRQGSEGAIFYSVPMLTRTTIQANVPVPPPPASAASPKRPGAPTQGTVYRL